ncbi:uncharacterized protein LOC123517306 isoform X5 [Portunus trituberculatus]|uniref:uncharacterized protein LOC123517306 isoform X5 n=1 Tax=Portunus trituberculatus TaxID=210409 RepID=UPI001E1D0283|nr:uncharacterized protein LOC123517306 isoform X5 [Portunus trituberculatus]
MSPLRRRSISVPEDLSTFLLNVKSPVPLRATKKLTVSFLEIGHVSTSPSVENVDQLGVEGPAGSGGKHAHSRSPSPSPSSRSRSRDRRPSSSTSHATGHLAAHAFNLMVTVPQSLSNDDQVTPPAMGKLTPDLLLGNHYEADISDQSDGCLGVPQGPGAAKSAPSTPQTEQRIVPRPLPRHDTFIAPGVSPALHTSPNFRPMKLKTTSFSKTNRHALKNLSRSTPAMSPSASPRHSDSEGQLRVSKGTKKFMRHFAEAPPSEWVLNYFSCALVSDILLQGTLYITHNYFAFYSKIFGHVSRLLIPVTQVASLQKERTAKIIPNAVGLQMLDGKNYVFGSLLSRDSTYKLMLHIWRKAQRMADSDSEPPSGVQVAAEDDGEDSVSGSANSLDQTDSGYLVSTAVNSLGSVPSPVTTTPWTTEEVTSTTNATTATNVYSTIDNSIPPTGNNIPMNSSTSTSDSTLLLGGGVVSGKVCAHEETNSNSATANSASDGKENSSMNILEWFTQGSLVKTCFKVGSVPMKLVGEGVKELWSLPRTSLLLLISTLLLLMLFASAAFMLHRVDLLSQQIGLEKYAEYDSMYEEVLQMQQRLHAAASTEIEKTLTIQLKHIATVRQSLEALMVLFNKDFPLEAAQIPDNT